MSLDFFQTRSWSIFTSPFSDSSLVSFPGSFLAPSPESTLPEPILPESIPPESILPKPPSPSSPFPSPSFPLPNPPTQIPKLIPLTQGAGETLRGTLNATVDRRFGHASPAMHAKNEDVINAGRAEIQTGRFAHQHEYWPHLVPGGGNNTDTNSGSSAGESDVGGVGAREGGTAQSGWGCAWRMGGRLGNLIAKASQEGLESGKGDGVGVGRQRMEKSSGRGKLRVVDV